MQPGAHADLSTQLIGKQPVITVDSNGGLYSPSTGLQGILTCWLVATIELQAGPSPSSLLNENPDPIVGILPPASTDSDMPFPPIPADTDHSPDPPLILDSDRQALQRLVSGTVPHDELPSLIGSIVTNVKAASIVTCLQGSDAQMFIDVIDQVCTTLYHLRGVTSLLISCQALDNFDLEPQVRRKCVKLLYKACSGHNILPKSLSFEPPENETRDILSRVDFADVSKCEYDGREVAVKVLRVGRRMPQNVHKVCSFWRATVPFGGAKPLLQTFYKEAITWRALRHPNVLPLIGAAMAGNQISVMTEWMTNGNINQFVNAHQDTNRLQLVSSLFKPLYPQLTMVMAPIAGRCCEGLNVCTRSGNDPWRHERGMLSNASIGPLCD